MTWVLTLLCHWIEVIEINVCDKSGNFVLLFAARAARNGQRAHILAAETQNLHSNLTIGDCAQSTYKIQAFVSEFSKV